MYWLDCFKFLSKEPTSIAQVCAGQELLLEFRRRTNGKVPERIVMYRDGVSEGQFEAVIAEEYGMIKQVCATGYRVVRFLDVLTLCIN